MNFGTPQEMVDDDRENKPDNNSLIEFIFLIVILVIICLLN